MESSKESKNDLKRMATPLKLAVWFAVLGTILLAVESPHRGMSMETLYEPAPASAPALATPPADYFPAQFPAPKGEPEAQPPTF